MGILQTYESTGNREGLSDILTYISPTERPLYSNLAKKRIMATYHEWQTQGLPTPAANTNTEGFSWSVGTITARSRTGNYTQIFDKCYSISRTQQNISIAGVKSELAEQKKLAYQNILRDIEKQLLDGTGNSGATDTARELKGIRSWISTTNKTGTGTGAENLTEIMFNDCLQDIKAAAGKPSDVYVNGYQKRVISSFTGRSSSAITIPATEKTAVNVVDVYLSDFGNVKIYYHDLTTTTEVLILQQDMWAIPILGEEGPMEVLPGSVDGTAFGIVLELSLESKNEAFSGKITQLNTSGVLS